MREANGPTAARAREPRRAKTSSQSDGDDARSRNRRRLGRNPQQAYKFEELRQAGLRFDKQFQLSVLSALLATILALLIYDVVAARLGTESQFQTVLNVIMPVFTFLIGIGTQATSSSKTGGTQPKGAAA